MKYVACASINSEGTVIGPFEWQPLLSTLKGSDRASLLQTLYGNQLIIPATDTMFLSSSYVGSFMLCSKSLQESYFINSNKAEQNGGF